jgi:hypothetical protein
MVTKATRDVTDLSIREITGGIRITGDNSANFSINGTTIGLTTAGDGAFVNLEAVNLTITGGTLDVSGAASVVGIDGEIPVGGVIFFNAAFATIPSNFQLCDGTNGTPDMTNQFVYGTNTEGELLDAGGSADAVVVSHNHGISDPGHTHTVFGSVDDGASKNRFDQGNNTRTQDNTSGSRTTGITIQSAGVSGTGKNIPPYIKLAFIQRMS